MAKLYLGSEEIVTQSLSPDQLRTLTQQHIRGNSIIDRRVLEAITAHPNTPPDLLLRLAPRYPASYLRNPLALVLMVEEPEFFAVLKKISGHRLLRRPDLPLYFLEWLFTPAATDPVLAADISLHITMAGECTKGEWGNLLHLALKRIIERSRGEARVELLELAELGIAPSWVSDLVRANSPFLMMDASPTEEIPPPDLALVPAYGLHMLARNSQPERRRAVAANPAADVRLLRQLAGDRIASVRHRAYHHPNADPGIRDIARASALRWALDPEGKPASRFFALCSPLCLREWREEAFPDEWTWLDYLATASFGEPKMQETLADDGNRLLRVFAREREPFPDFLLT